MILTKLQRLDINIEFYAWLKEHKLIQKYKSKDRKKYHSLLRKITEKRLNAIELIINFPRSC